VHTKAIRCAGLIVLTCQYYLRQWLSKTSGQDFRRSARGRDKWRRERLCERESFTPKSIQFCRENWILWQWLNTFTSWLRKVG